jgi:hypothetical protein
VADLQYSILQLSQQQTNLIAPRTLDLTSIKLTVDAASALADAISVEWGLRKLLLRDCDLDELVILRVIISVIVHSDTRFSVELEADTTRIVDSGNVVLIVAVLEQTIEVSGIQTNRNIH